LIIRGLMSGNSWCFLTRALWIEDWCPLHAGGPGGLIASLQEDCERPSEGAGLGRFGWRVAWCQEFLEQGEMMNDTRYQQVFEDKLEFIMHQHGTTHFLQTWASCHTSKIVTKGFSDCFTIQLIRWLGNSLGLNLTKNVLVWMKLKLQDAFAKKLDGWKKEILQLCV
jgi:hypothetical protein